MLGECFGKRNLFSLLTLCLLVASGLAGIGTHPLLAQRGRPSRPLPAAAAPADPGLILATRTRSSDGGVPVGTIWRTFQTWRTDVARTEKGELVPVDSMSPRLRLSGNGNIIRDQSQAPAALKINPAGQVHGSAYPPADWQAADFDDRDWTRDPSPQRELYGLIALRCLRGKFQVTDTANVKNMSLTVRYRGAARGKRLDDSRTITSWFQRISGVFIREAVEPASGRP
jgi:hypothetical protein